MKFILNFLKKNRFSYLLISPTIVAYIGNFKSTACQSLTAAEKTYLEGMANHKFIIIKSTSSNENKISFHNYIAVTTTSKNGRLWETAEAFEEHSNRMKFRKGEFSGDHFVTSLLPRIYSDTSNVMQYLSNFFDILQFSEDSKKEIILNNPKDYLKLDKKATAELFELSEAALDIHGNTFCDSQSQPKISMIEISNAFREKMSIEEIKLKVKNRIEDLTAKYEPIIKSLNENSKEHNFNLAMDIAEDIKSSEFFLEKIDSQFQDIPIKNDYELTQVIKAVTGKKKNIEELKQKYSEPETKIFRSLNKPQKNLNEENLFRKIQKEGSKKFETPTSNRSNYPGHEYLPSKSRNLNDNE